MALPLQASVPVAAISNELIMRRSADYKPPIWSFEDIQSLKVEYEEESFKSRIKKLKEDVIVMLEEKEMDKVPLQQLELIDTLQRLGLSYHFENEINRILEKVYTNNQGYYYGFERESLYMAALEFRILRQHGYKVPQEIFKNFVNEGGNFKACLNKDCKGMLYLYEASFLSLEGESTLDGARTFARNCLSEYVKLDESKNPYLSTLVEHALEFPLRWRMARMEARWFIEVYQRSPDMNPLLLDLAKLDFNMVQAIYQEDLKHASMWWKGTGLGKNLGFIRDRLMENFLWTTGVFFQPQYGYFRRMTTQVGSLITTIDDVYDVYGTLDELELFTDAIERFWLDLCKTYLIEVKWYHQGYTPSLQEYIDNAVISVSAPLLVLHAYILSSNHITTKVLQYLEEELPSIIRCSSMVLRLADDLGTSSDEMRRGDVPKSIQCYMHETGVLEEYAREHIQDLIDKTWKKMNKYEFEPSLLPQTLIEAAINVARMAQFMYKHGDGHSSQDDVMRHRILSLLIEPIPLPRPEESHITA
ncbi:hypothetical protein SLEP1_g7748 [Rubroshorea leprosula]|uniref:Uncharacterized protein n=1 Tax=Rubroshorea leprosula TaxID=152421 RepID=A0AAV5HZE4_9ROSI|nr:hypothetical protein SLEP1_g7748 [Rubroshorea leprosula]